MNDFKATTNQWDMLEQYAKSNCALDNCILELRARVAKLETQASNYSEIPDSSTPPTVATDEELNKIWNFEDTWKGSIRAVYNLGVTHGQVSSREVAEPAPVAGGLMERVKLAIDSALYDEDDHQWNEARAAILEVARWMREQGWKADVSEAADMLVQEAGR